MPSLVKSQLPDLEDKLQREDAGARWFRDLDAALTRRGGPALSAGQLWVGERTVAEGYGTTCSMLPLGPSARFLWLVGARLWWPLERADAVADPGAWLAKQGPRSDLAAGIKSGHEVLVEAVEGYVAVPAALDGQLFRKLRRQVEVQSLTSELLGQRSS
mmetsp:Transcript_71032/g.230603  ORF Transcript_71032/g.230603 Transcript_71032/m.230603 type:complete len:159 (-) Transcript_71032:503-979(-)